MNYLINNAAILQILLPLVGALVAAVSYHRAISWGIALGSILISQIMAFSNWQNLALAVHYNFGNWPAVIGIEYRFDYLNQALIIIVNFTLLFFLLFGRYFINQHILKYLQPNRSHIFYALILLAHFGYLGLSATNDLFNLYVFIEISSLATYALIAQGNDRAVIGAFDYLILGTIGATLILFSIGLFLATTGSLNISYIADYLSSHQDLPILIKIAVSLFLVGAMLKLAFFPLHFWMLRAYQYCAAYSLTYIAAISSLIGVYLILRFRYSLVHQFSFEFIEQLWQFLAYAAIIIGALLAIKASSFSKIILFSTTAQIGYIFLLLTNIGASSEAIKLLLALLGLECLNKIGLFTILAHLQDKTADLSFANIPNIEDSLAFKLLAFACLLFSAGLPMTAMFLYKIQLFTMLIDSGHWLSLVVVVFGSVLAIIYHLRLAQPLFFRDHEKTHITINQNLLGLAIIVLIQFSSLIFYQELALMIEQVSLVFE